MMPQPLPSLARRGRAPRGVTLVELMIVAAIVAIVAAFAVPSFSEYVRKSRRADAWTLLQQAQAAQERHRQTNVAYTADAAALGVCTVASPCGSEHYTLQVSQASGSAYTLTATARAGSPQADDAECPSIVLSVSGAAVSQSPAACGKK